MKYHIALFILILTTGCSSLAQSSVDNKLETAPAEKEAEEKYLLMIFSGSDWCKPCMQLKQKILRSTAFMSYSDHSLALQEVDFPYKKKNKLPKAKEVQNNALADQYNPEGVFPKILLFDENQNMIGEINYEKHMTTEEFIHLLNSKIEKQ